MTNVIVRNVPPNDVAVLKQAAADAGVSLQAYLGERLRNEAARRRRQEAVDRMRARMAGHSTLTAAEVAESVSVAREERSKSMEVRP